MSDRFHPVPRCTALAARAPLLCASLVASQVVAADAAIVVQSTTSTANSGLYDHLLPDFEAAHEIDVRVVAVGTGQAIANARHCDGDVLLVHSRPDEEAFVEEGHGIERFDLMYNDFVIVGPADNPAGIATDDSARTALARIARAEAPFVSRADESGTHKKEMQLWAETPIDPVPASGNWYRETGSGMGATLNAAVGMGAYALTDRATWISFGNRGDHVILVEGDEALFNQYGVIAVSPDACPNVDAAAAGTFVDWLLSPGGQEAIASYRVDGQQLFYPNFNKAP